MQSDECDPGAGNQASASTKTPESGAELDLETISRTGLSAAGFGSDPARCSIAAAAPRGCQV